MRLLIGDEKVRLSKRQLNSMYIGGGVEADVFKYGDEAIKLYRRSCEKDRLTKKEARGLIGIPTKRVLLPQKIIKSSFSKAFRGYTTPFISNNSINEVTNMKMGQFLDEVTFLEDDMELLADNKVAVHDLQLFNTLYNGNIYFCDPGSYAFRSEVNSGVIRIENMFGLNHFLLSELFSLVKTDIYKRTDYIYSYDWNNRLSLQMGEKADPNETISQHVKRMTR